MDALIRTWLRAHNTSSLVTLHRVDDTPPVQRAQFEGYQSELRDGMPRHQHFGLSAVPLPGSKGVALYQSGHRGAETIISAEDPRYRPTGQQPGCVTVYIVDGAQPDGSGGATRPLLQGLLGWIAKLFGKTIYVGDGNTQTVTITAASAVIITDGNGTPQPVKLADGSNSRILMAV